MGELIVSRESKLTIDQEFKNLIPPLTTDEYKRLEDSIIADGCRDALILWGDVIVDGHNRYDICTKHGISYKTVQKDFATRDDVKLWMMSNQLARRNLSDFQRVEIVSKCEAEVRRRADIARVANLRHVEVENFPPRAIGKSRDELGALAGVSGKTYEHAIKVLHEAPQDVVEAVRAGEMSIDKAYKAVKAEEKRQDIQRAQEAIAAQVAESPDRPLLRIGNGIGHIPEQDYDLLLTDPPYSTDVDDIDAFARSWLYNALDHVKDTGFAYVFIGAYPRELRAYLNIDPPPHMELTQVLVWSYRNTLGITPKDRYDQSYQVCLFYRGKNAPALNCPLTSEKWAVMEVNAPGGITVESTGDARYHAWQKPMEIAERFVRHSTEPGMTVFDPFACTGTFLLAAAKLGRKAYGYEINPDNAALAFERGCAHDV